MSSNSKKDSRSRNKKNRILVFFLYLAIILFFLWLLGFLWFLFLNEPKKYNNDGTLSPDNPALENNTATNKSDGLNEADMQKESNRTTGEMEKNLGDPDRDEFQPSMDTLFEKRELTFENIDEIFENMKSPKKPKIHSTFGKEVIYIYHSHSRESFLPYLNNTFQPEEAYHSIANITLVGKMLGRSLESNGIGTNVNTTDIVQLLDAYNLDYGSSYDVSGELVKHAQKENRDLEYFIDVHRDSLRKEATTVEINGLNYAKLLFVVGTGHENYEKNLKFANELQTILDSKYQGLSKGILQKSSSQGNGIYNQDLSPNTIILEIGGVDNTAEELYRAIEAFAAVLSDYYWNKEE